MNEEKSNLEYPSYLRAHLFGDALSAFIDIPQLADTRYRPDKFIPIEKKRFQSNENYVAFAGISYLFEKGKFVEPKICCISHNPKAVESYMFGCRQYHCLRSLLNDKDFEMPTDLQLRFHGAGIIHCASFESKDAFMTFLIDTKMEDYLMEPWLLNKELCGYLPHNKKAQVPQIVLSLIGRQVNEAGDNLKRTWDDLRHLFYYFNMAKKYPHSALGLSEPLTDDGASTIYDACGYLAAMLPPYLDIPVVFPSKSNGAAKSPDQERLSFQQYITLMQSSNPIFFMKEEEYRMEIASEAVARGMDREYKDKIAPYIGRWDDEEPE